MLIVPELPLRNKRIKNEATLNTRFFSKRPVAVLVSGLSEPTPFKRSSHLRVSFLLL
jgi:hypothetical protein